jgi:catechol 2,3-dioxygenase-like lactoylglutathione lyase family enzyme
MPTGAHVVIYSKDAAADRAFFRDILGFRSVDAGHGWLIFGVPAAEVAFHPHDQNNKHEMYFICDDLKAEKATLEKKGVHLAKYRKSGGGLARRFCSRAGAKSACMNRNTPLPLERQAGEEW